MTCLALLGGSSNRMIWFADFCLLLVHRIFQKFSVHPAGSVFLALFSAGENEGSEKEEGHPTLVTPLLPPHDDWLSDLTCTPFILFVEHAVPISCPVALLGPLTFRYDSGLGYCEEPDSISTLNFCASSNRLQLNMASCNSPYYEPVGKQYVRRLSSLLLRITVSSIDKISNGFDENSFVSRSVFW